MKKLILVAFLISIASYSCKKKGVFTKNNLEFSSDTLIFDTVFTTVGSTTKRLKFYNNNTLPIQVDEIELVGGDASPFNLNVDGISGKYHENFEMAGQDSLFLFVEVTLSVNGQNLPLIVEDSIRFRTNGKDQYVNLAVWGQDAYFHVNELVSGTWANDKPHVIYGLAAVGHFDPFGTGQEVKDQTLIIPAGTTIHSHKNSALYVYKSSLIVEGTLGNEVHFKHDRLEPFYDEQSGQWRGIILSQANYSTIEYAIIENAAVGLQVDTTTATYTLDLKNTIIQNSQFYNLFLVAGPKVVAENCVFGDAGLISTYLFAGGEAQFKHCNFVNYWTGSRGGPAFAVKNWWEFEDFIYTRDVINTSFDNCIMYGNALTEFVIDTFVNSPALFDVTSSNCLIKREEPYGIDYNYLLNTIWNDLPLFIDTDLKDFNFEAGSPLDNAGISTAGVVLDIEGNSRNLTSPDIGAYEN